MTKREIIRNGKKIYLLGKDKDGINYWLVAPSWDCGWYWGFGYIQAYTNNKRPDLARDVRIHTHFDSLFFNKNKNGYDMFKEFFVETVLSNDETWKLLDYMKTFYTLQAASELFYSGSSHYTSKAALEAIKANDKEVYNLINTSILPELFEKVKNLLTKEEA